MSDTVLSERTGDIYGPYVRAVRTGVKVRPGRTVRASKMTLVRPGRTYDPDVRVVCTSLNSAEWPFCVDVPFPLRTYSLSA